jgi:hypothetical protein
VPLALFIAYGNSSPFNAAVRWIVVGVALFLLSCDRPDVGVKSGRSVEPPRPAPTPIASPKSVELPKAATPIQRSSLIPRGKFYGPPRLVEQFTEAQPIYDVHEDPELMKGTPFEVVCRGRAPCRELMSEDAGKTSQGSLRVVSVSLAPEGFERQFEPGSCEPIEHWAVTTNASGQVVRFQLLLELCNDGYGASGIGDDTIEVTPNHLAHAQIGGSNHRWNHAVTYQLYPRRIAAWSEGGMIASTGSHFD